MTQESPPPLEQTAARLRYFFVTPWWRLPLFLAAIVWLVGLNAIDLADGASDQWLGPVSVVPVHLFAVDVFIRSSRGDKGP